MPRERSQAEAVIPRLNFLASEGAQGYLQAKALESACPQAKDLKQILPNEGLQIDIGKRTFPSELADQKIESEHSQARKTQAIIV